MNKKIWILLSSIFIFICVVAAGTLLLFSVDTVQLYFTDKTSAGLADSGRLSAELDEKFMDKNILFVGEEDVDGIFSSYPYIKKISVEKVYPDKIIIYAEEIEERYAVKNGDSYDMLDEDFNYLSTNEVNENRADSHSNILLENFGYGDGTFREKEAIASAAEVIGVFDDKLNGVRNNILKIEFSSPTTSREDSYFVLYTVEGVEIRIFSPLSSAEKKAEGAAEKYKELSVEEKMYGIITVVENKLDGGRITVSYTKHESVS